MNNYLCVYLDILVFKNFLKQDIRGAAGLLQDYNDVLVNGEYEFENFLAGSDSVFILSSDPGKCIADLARYVTECFELNSRAFSAPEDLNDPSIVKLAVPVFENGKAVTRHESTHWFPLLFRGGISHGEAILFHPQRTLAGVAGTSSSVFGEGIVSAVLLEQKGYAGPMIAVDSKAYESVPALEQRFLRKLDDDTGLYELLWPLSKWPLGTTFDILRSNLMIDLGSVMNLYNTYGSDKSGKHYKSLLMLYLRSAFRAMTEESSEEEAMKALLDIPGVSSSFFKWPN